MLFEVVLQNRAQNPIAVLFEPVVFKLKVLQPSAVFPAPAAKVVAANALYPTAVLLPAAVATFNASNPTAVFCVPLIFEFSAVIPNAVQDIEAELPCPTRTELTVMSLANVDGTVGVCQLAAVPLDAISVCPDVGAALLIATALEDVMIPLVAVDVAAFPVVL